MRYHPSLLQCSPLVYMFLMIVHVSLHNFPLTKLSILLNRSIPSSLYHLSNTTKHQYHQIVFLLAICFPTYTITISPGGECVATHGLYTQTVGTVLAPAQIAMSKKSQWVFERAKRATATSVLGAPRENLRSVQIKSSWINDQRMLYPGIQILIHTRQRRLHTTLHISPQQPPHKMT